MRLAVSLLSCLPLCSVIAASGQDKPVSTLELDKLPILTDKAPPPSDRFPASWYPGPSDETFRLSIEKKAPYIATLVITYQQQSEGNVITQTTSTIQARDSAGRTHEETGGTSASYDSKKDEMVAQRDVTVFDPVSHCTFSWMEPAVSERPIALVKCLPSTIHYTNLSYSTLMWSVGSRPLDTLFDPSRLPKGSSSTTESLGKRTFGDVEAEGSRITATNTTQAGEVKKSLTEMWYSPDIKEIVQLKFDDFDLKIPPSEQVPYMQLTNIKRTEPDPSLFYPPREYEIQPTLQ